MVVKGLDLSIDVDNVDDLGKRVILLSSTCRRFRASMRTRRSRRKRIADVVVVIVGDKGGGGEIGVGGRYRGPCAVIQVGEGE